MALKIIYLPGYGPAKGKIDKETGLFLIKLKDDLQKYLRASVDVKIKLLPYNYLWEYKVKDFKKFFEKILKDTLKNITKELKNDRIILVGHSLGGLVTLLLTNYLYKFDSVLFFVAIYPAINLRKILNNPLTYVFYGLQGKEYAFFSLIQRFSLDFEKIEDRILNLKEDVLKRCLVIFNLKDEIIHINNSIIQRFISKYRNHVLIVDYKKKGLFAHGTLEPLEKLILHAILEYVYKIKMK